MELALLPLTGMNLEIAYGAALCKVVFACLPSAGFQSELLQS